MIHVGLLEVVLASLFTYTFVSGASAGWASGHPFPPTARGSAIFSVCLLFLGSAMLLYLRTLSEGHRSPSSARRLLTKFPTTMSTLLTLLFALQLLLYFSGSNVIGYHPIDMLIYDAKRQHKTWLKQASASRTLNQATEEYRRRYNRHPPP